METMPIAFSSKQQSMKTSDNVANTLGANDYKEPQAVAIQNATRGASQNGLGITTDGPMYTLDVGSQHAVAFQPTADCLTAAYSTKWNGNASATNGSLFAAQSSAVRRLTPIECERLQGFPDNYTDIRLNDKQTPDGPRYKAMGNSMAVPVMNWIGRRIQMVEDTE
jgi:site-specific DNA-cytosine methylase